MSQLVTQTTTYGLSSDQYSISTLSSVGGVLEIMAGNPHDGSTASTPIVDFKSDKSVKFYGIADLSNGVTLPEKVIGTKHLADKSVTSAKIAENVNIVGNLTGTASKATADASGNVITDTYAPKASPTFTGTVTVPTPSTSDNSTKVASTAYVKSNLANYLPLAGGTMTGAIKTSSSDSLVGANNTIRVHICGGTGYKCGGSLQLDGSEVTETGSYKRGRFALTAHNGTTGKELIGLPDGTLVWGGKNVVRSVNGTAAGSDGNVVLTSAVPTGTILPFCGTSAPTGFLICNGGAISRESYSALFKLIGTKYGGGNGSTTFNLPNMHHRFLEGTTTTSEVNTYVEAGLPNIVGYFGASRLTDTDNIMTTSGALYDGGTLNGSTSPAYNNNGEPSNSIGLDASRSSAIYGNSTTVQPSSIRTNFIVKY